ncbi:aromatic acid exporter family protein [Nocardiopsis alba]|uniref:FUSC family protein n=1 Tax=Nocardiopsis alba TaxID=53437 RepID=UPI0005A98E03|nr:aromatic acid exporter family protein [Nocardiopsis alba]
MIDTRLRRLRRGLDRVYSRRGFERETAVIILKSAVAATLAYVVAYLLGASTQIGFAPFTALLVVRPSVYGSVLQSGRYVAAVFAGALVAGLTGLTVGATVWSFALVVLVALAFGQVRFFGEQGTQIPVVAAFALAGGTATDAQDLGSLLSMVCVGAVCALLTNVFLAPAIRFKDAENAVLDFASSLRSLTGEIADGLSKGKDGLDLDQWSDAADGLDGVVSNALESVRRQEDRFRLNPRRLVAPRRIPDGGLDVYRDWIQALSRSSRHVQSLVRTLRTTVREGSRFPAPDDAFLRELAPLLERASEIFRLVHDQEEPERRVVSDELRSLIEDTLRGVDENREQVRERWDDACWPVYSALLTDTERLLEELHQGYENTTREGERGDLE